MLFLVSIKFDITLGSKDNNIPLTGEENKSIIKDETGITFVVVITILPFFGYLLSFIYEYGYSSYFNIPYEFISVK